MVSSVVDAITGSLFGSITFSTVWTISTEFCGISLGTGFTLSVCGDGSFGVAPPRGVPAYDSIEQQIWLILISTNKRDKFQVPSLLVQVLELVLEFQSLIESFWMHSSIVLHLELWSMTIFEQLMMVLMVVDLFSVALIFRHLIQYLNCLLFTIYSNQQSNSSNEIKKLTVWCHASASDA